MSEHQGVLAIWHDIENSRRSEVLRWYDHEHHAERVGIDGFQRARRYSHVAGGNGPELFICYSTESVEVLKSRAYLDRVDAPTEWTQRAMPHIQGNIRSACRVVYRCGTAEGAYVGVTRIKPVANMHGALRHHLVDSVLTRLCEQGIVLSAQLWEIDEGSTNIHSRERVLRRVPDRTADWVVVVSGSSVESVSAPLDGQLSAHALHAAGAETDSASGIYQLQYQLHRDQNCVDHIEPTAHPLRG